MTEVLDRIEFELIAAVRRSNARRRRRRTLGFFSGAACAVVLTAGGAVTAITNTPLERLFEGKGGHRTFVAADTAQRTDVRVRDAVGTGWTVTLYRAQGGWLAMPVLPDGLSPSLTPALSARNSFAFASELADGRAMSLGVFAAKRDGQLGRVLAGQVDASVQEVAVELGGRRYATELTPDAVRMRVVLPAPDRLTPQGRAFVKRIGDEISVRAFAGALPQDAIPESAGEVDATVVMTLADGTVERELRRRICTGPSCGLVVFKLPDKDG